MGDPKKIYLQPACCADEAIGRLWCEDDAPVDCEDGVPWTKYVRADEIERLRSEIKSLQDEADVAAQTNRALQAERDALLLAMQEVHLATIIQEGATAPEHLRLVRNLAQAAIDAARKP